MLTELNPEIAWSMRLLRKVFTLRSSEYLTEMRLLPSKLWRNMKVDVTLMQSLSDLHPPLGFLSLNLKQSHNIHLSTESFLVDRSKFKSQNWN